MLARAHTFTTDGLHVLPVTLEVDIRSGLPAFVIVGLADAAVREARERVQAAIRNSGFEFPVVCARSTGHHSGYQFAGRSAESIDFPQRPRS